MNKGYLKHRYGKEDISIDEMEKINSATLENKPDPFIDPAYKNYQFSYDDPRYSKFSDRISSTTPNKEIVAQDAQGGGEIFKNSLQGFGVNMAAGFVDNAGSTLAFFTGDALNMALGRTEKEYGNFLNNIAQDTREWGQEMFPIYNASDSMITGAYWGMQFSNLGTTAGIMAEAFAEQAIGGLVIKGIASLGKASKLASVINGIKKIETVASTAKAKNIAQFSFGMMQGIKEAHMNGLENYHGVYQEYIEKGRSEEEAIQAAKEASTKSYRIEIVPIALMNGLQWRAIGGKYNPYSRGGVQATGVSDVTGSLFGKLVPKSAGKKTKIAFDYLGNMLSESIEEGWQETSQSIGHYQVDKERGYTEGDSVLDYIFTTELRDSMVGGALGGGFFRGVGGMFTSRATKGQRKQQEEIINKFIETTTERGNNLLIELASAEKAGNVQAAQQIKQELGYSNIENALLYDYMRNDDKLTAYNAQIESLKEMKDIIDRGDQEGLELMGLIDEKNENGVNEYQYLKDNLGDMIADAEQQKADFTKNLEFQMENFNEENVIIAQRITQAQFMKRKNEQAMEGAEKNITDIEELNDGILNSTEQEYQRHKAKLFAFNNMSEELSPQLQEEKRESEQRIKDIEDMNTSDEESGNTLHNLEFNEEGSAEKSLINANQRLAMVKNANHSLSTDIKDLKTGEGVQKFNDKRIKKEVESFRKTNDVESLNRVQNILNNNERVKELYSETELETMKKAVEDKISKENSKTERQKSLERKLREQQAEEDRVSKREEKENKKKREENKEDIPTYKKGDKITYLEEGKEKQGVITDDTRAVSGKYKIGTEGKQVSQKRIKGLTSEESTITRQEDKVGLTEEERITNILESNIDTIDENLEKEAPVHEKAGDVARKASELANNIVDDSDLFFGKDDTTTITGVDDFIDSLAPAELDPNAKALRDYLKADAEAYLLRNPNATLADYIRSFIQNEEVMVADIDKLFYYYADGFYEAKNERYTDNLAEVKDVYKALLEPYNKVDVSKKALELFNEVTKRETKNQELTEQEKKDAQKEIEKQTQKELLKKEGQVIEIDEFGNPVKYKGQKTAAPYVNVPFNGVPYKSIRMTDPKTGEVTHMFVKDEDAISRNLISEATTLEGIKRAFMMDPSLAKEGVPIKAYIPSLNELMDDTNGFVVVTWTKGKDGVLESSTMPFSKWMNLEETTSYIDDSGNAVTQIVDKSPGSQRFLEKVPMFMSAEINGQEVQMGSVLHETDWWNERNIADFRNSDVYKEALNSYEDKRSESAIEYAEKVAQAKQDAVIREGKKQTFEARKQIWENSKETWESGERTEVGMTISEVSDGLTLRIDDSKPKRSIREANNDLMVGLVLERDGESQFVISSDEGGSYDVLPKNRIYNSSILDETAKPGFALTAIPFKTDADGNMMYLLQMVDTGYSAAQQSLNYLHQQELKIKGIIEEYQRAFLKDKNSTETQKLRTQLENIFDTAKSKNHKGALNTPGRVGYGSALEKFAFQNLFRNYPRKNTKTGNLSVSFNKDNISGKVSEIVVLDENGKPSVYKPNPDSNDNSVVQMLKENIYTDHDYIEIRDLQNQDPNATKKVANAQPRVKIEFNNEITQRQSDAKIKEAERLQKEAADKIRLEEEAKRLAEEQERIKKGEKPEVKKISLTDGQKFTVLNNLFHKILGKFKTENVSKQDLARELRGILEESIADIKESNPELHAYFIKNKDSIIGLNQFKDSPGTLREAVQEHFNIENLSEADADNLDMESTLEKNHSKTAQENDVRTSISSKLKRFFAGIPVNNQKRRGEAVEGMVEYMEIDDVFAAVQDLLADAPNNFEVLQQRIKEKIALNENEFGFLEHVLDRINDKNIDKQIQREILFKLNQTKNRMFFVYSKNNKGNFVLQVYDANSRQPLINIKTASSEQFKSSELVENLGDGNYKVNIGEAERSSRVMNLVIESKTPLFKETRESLADLGIYVEESTLEALHKQNPSKYKNNIDNLFKTFQANILELKNKPTLSFENKRENLLLNNTNNYLNNLLGEIIKVTFNIDQSMSVAGKTINAFSQPNFFSEQVRKLLSLKGEDLNEGSKHLAKQLLDNGYSKNSMTLQLLTERNKFDGSLSERAKVILSEMFLGYTSLDVLKRQNSKSEENSLSEVSPSDYDTTIMGFFGDMSKRIEGTWNNIKMRMASMTSPTLSDSSQMFLFNTVVLDLTSENLNVTDGRFIGYNEDVAKTLYEQLILPELTRAIEIKGTERDVIGNQLIYSIPAVNAIEVDGKSLHNFIRENQITEEYTVDMMLKDISDIFGNAINDIVHNTIATEVRSKINIDENGKLVGSWVDDGFIVQDKGAMKSEILDSEFLASKFKDGSALGRTEVAAWDFVINYYLAQSQIQMLFAGDAANYTKARDNHFQKNENGITDVANPKTLNGTQQEKSDVYVNIARNTSENLSKRLKALISPGNRVAFSQGKQYIQLMIEDSIEISSQYKEYLRSWYQDKDISKEDLANIDYIIETAEFLKEFEGRVVPKEGSEQHIGYAVDQRMYEAQKAKVQEIISNLKNKYPDIAGYLENASTDAQEYTTWQEHLDIMYDMGKLSTEQYESVKNKLQLQSQGKFDTSTLLTVDEKVVFQPMKPLHSGMYFREMDNGSSFQEFVYVKSSSFPLIPEMTRNINLDNLRKNMENLQEKQDMPVRASYQTANKVGGVVNPMNINQLLNNSDLNITEGFSILDRDNFSIQQEKPFKTDKNIDTSERDQVGRGTQIEKILLGNGINKIQDKIFPNLFGEELIKELGIEVSEDGNISGEDLHTLFTDISIKEQALKKEQFLKELDIDPNDFQLGSVKSMESLQSALSKRLPNRQDKEILSLKYFVKNRDGSGQYYTKEEIQKNKLTPNSAEFSFPIWLSPNSRKFESVLNSMVTNEFIKLKLPGNSFPVASEIGFRPNKTLSDLTSSESMGIVYTDNYNGQELLPERTINGVTYPAQVLIASKFRRKVVNPITKAVTEEIIDFNTPEYINPETGRLDSSKVPREVLELFSFRIPTSAHQSGSIAEVVGFLPHSSGDLMVVPNEHTTKIGEDYDIDTRYTYSGNYIVGEDGSIRLTKKEDVAPNSKEEIEVLENEIINLYKSLYLSNNNEVQKLITTTINTEMADTTAKLMDAKINSSSDQNSFSIFGYEHQKSIMRLGSSGKLGIGVHSNWVVWNGLVQQSKSDIGITGMNMQIGYFNSDGKLGNATALKPNQELIPEGLKKNYTGFQPRMISEINMENQNSATDNQKLQIMGKRNENKYTINVFALMNNLGFDKDVVSINGKNVEMLTSSLFINQPILRRYVELRENQSSVFAEFTRSAERDIQQKLKEEFGTNVDFYINEKTGEISDMLTDEAMEKASLDMTGQTLYDSLVNPTDNNVQWAVLQKFIQLQEHATNVNKVIQMMNIDKGLGISYFNILAKKNILIKEMNSENLGISNVETLFGEQYTDENGEVQPVYEENTELVDNLLEQGYIKIGVDESTGEVFLRKPNSANSAKLLNSVSMGYYLWGNIFPFENRYFAQQIDDILSATNKQDRYDDRTMETRYDILVSIRDYMYSLNNLDLFKDNKSGDINDERRRLLVDNKETNKESLAGYLVRLKKEATTNPDLAQLFNKAFFRNLEFVINKNEPSLIKYSINNTNSLNKNLPHTELSRMSESQEILPAFNGDENYTHEKLVDDLLRYSLLNNVENGAIGFRNYIPMKVFQKHNIDSKLTALANMQVGGGRFFNILYNGTLKAVTSFIGNESYSTDNQGDYMEIPNNIASNPTQMFSLNRIVDNVNRTLGENTLEINSNNEVRINRPTNDIDKGRFVRQFYQHNPQHAQRINHEQAGIKRNEVQNADVIDAFIELDEDAKLPDYVSMMDNNKQLHLYELATEQDYSTESKGIRYNRINKLGGFGVNEFNPNSEVRTSIFESNNVKEIAPGERALSTKNRNVNKGIFDIANINSKQEGITVAEAVELFSQEKLDLNNPEVVRLKNILDNLMDFVDPNTKVYKESLTQGPGKYNTGNNIISLDVNKIGPDRVNNLFRVFVEEVVHSISAREIETFINTKESTISVSNDEVILDAKRIVGRTSAPIEKLLQLYKKSVETLIDQEITAKNGAINKQEAFANILNRDPKLDTTGYRIQNLHEFVAGIMSDATFRNQMNKIEYRNTGQTILKQFADFIGKILSNISDRVNNSITEQTISSTIELINSIPTDISPRMNPLTRLQKLEAERRAKALLKSTKTVEINNNSELSIVTRENYLNGKLDDNIIAKFLATGDATIVVNGQANTDLMNLRNEMREDLKKKKETKNPNKNPGNITVNGITLNNDQQIAYDDIMDFLNDPTRKTHSLIGYAGTGKTTLLNIIEKGFAVGPFDNMIFTSPTHRANAVIRLKNPNATVHTLHSLLGLGIEQDLETFDISVANFKPKGDIKVGEGDVIVIDESSMINDKLYDMINKVIGDKGAKVLFVGDDAQIKPVKQSHQSKALTSTEMSSQLNIVERANNNSLLEESMSIREKGDFTYESSMKDNKGIQFINNSKEFLTKAFDMFKSQEFKDNPLLLRILSGTNAKVAEVNAQIRQALFGKDAQDYMAGDIIMGYANWKVDYKTKVPKMSNGGDYVVLSSKTDTQMIAGVEVKGHTVELQNVLDTNQDSFISFIISKDTDISVLEAIGKEYETIRQEGIRSKGADAARAWAKLNTFKNSFMTPVNITYKGYTKIGKTLNYGYVHTIHKSQGGTYKYSFVMDNTIDAFQDRELRSQLKYVAATRAEEGTFVLTNKEISEKDDVVKQDVKEIPTKKVVQPTISKVKVESLKTNDVLKIDNGLSVKINSRNTAEGTSNITINLLDGKTQTATVSNTYIQEKILNKYNVEINAQEVIDSNTTTDIEGDTLSGEITTLAPNQGDMSMDLSIFTEVKQNIFENCR